MSWSQLRDEVRGESLNRDDSMSMQLGYFADYFSAIGSTSSRNKKIEILSEMKRDLPYLLKWFYLRSSDWQTTYGLVLDEDEILSLETNRDSGGLASWVDLDETLERLASRQLTGSRASFKVREYLQKFDPSVRKWFVRVINKDLKIGASIGTFDKIFPGLITPFEPQLCGNFLDLKDDYDSYSSIWVEPKYDGLRGIVIIRPGQEPQAISRGGHELFNIQKVATYLTQPGVYDGEFFSGDWSTSMSAARTEKGDPEKLKYVAFDKIPLIEWDSKNFVSPLYLRRHDLAQSVRYQEGDETVKVTQTYLAKNKDSVNDIARTLLSMGFEGGVVKNATMPYKLGDRSDWLKVKFKVTGDFVIRDVLEGTGKNLGRLGAFVVESSPGVLCNVGGGFKDVDRIAFWENRELMIGRTIEVEYQERTPDRALRFPVFKCLRVDK